MREDPSRSNASPPDWSHIAARFRTLHDAGRNVRLSRTSMKIEAGTGWRWRTTWRLWQDWQKPADDAALRDLIATAGAKLVAAGLAEPVTALQVGPGQWCADEPPAVVEPEDVSVVWLEHVAAAGELWRVEPFVGLGEERFCPDVANACAVVAERLAAAHPEPVVPQAPAVVSPKAAHPEPRVLLHGWGDILSVLPLPIQDETARTRTRRRILRLNRESGGPIVSKGQGSQPVVDKAELVAWWNAQAEGIEGRKQSAANRKADREATVEGQYDFGKGGRVVPEIGGAVKRRRGDRKP